MRTFDPSVEQAVERLRSEVGSPDVAILPSRQWARAIFEEEGVALIIDQVNTEVFEVMRRRPLWSRRWRSVQSPQRVVENLLWFMRNRPDLRYLRE